MINRRLAVERELCIQNVNVNASTYKKDSDEDGIRTHAGRAHWISSPTP